jgi:hypothetical protein
MNDETRGFSRRTRAALRDARLFEEIAHEESRPLPSAASHVRLSAGDSDVPSRDVLDYAFFRYSLHQPCGLIVPSTVWQELGGSN